MRARIIFIILLVLILIFTLWPTVISLGAEWYGRWHGCEVEFTGTGYRVKMRSGS